MNYVLRNYKKQKNESILIPGPTPGFDMHKLSKHTFELWYFSIFMEQLTLDDSAVKSARPRLHSEIGHCETS